MKKDLLYEGKAKKLFSVEGNDELVIQEFKDDATAFNGLKKDKISHKGEINNQITSVIFEFLNNSGIPTHYIGKLSDTEMLVKKVEIIKAEVICRNIAAGSMVKKLGFEEGKKLGKPIIEFYLKSDELGDPLFTVQHILALEIATDEEIRIIKELTMKINDLLTEFFHERGIKLVDFKLEFGRDQTQEGKGNIILADEISPDTCRLWDLDTNKKLDKDRFRFDLGEVEEAYQEIKNRLSLI
jgi:phosphoribosylaminoimidazole-succinocarboxamide synthase